MKPPRPICSAGNVVWGVLAVLTVAVGAVPAAWAEPVAPGIHWGAIAYPDRDRTLIAGVTFNRFTEFDGAGRRFNAIEESAGFNFATISWTERLKALPGWNTNLTAGVGPTHADPTLYLQNDFAHRLVGDHSVPVDQQREQIDFMINGSATRWIKLFGEREIVFVGVGFASGSLYHEAFGRAGLRRLSLAELLEPVVGQNTLLRGFSRFVRFSGMGQYGRLFGGSAYGDSVLADQAYVGQGSVSIADYADNEFDPPPWELEFAVTFDSGLFATPAGHSIKRSFGSIALRFPYGFVETWNDELGGTDRGPTYGFQIMFNVLRIYDRLARL